MYTTSTPGIVSLARFNNFMILPDGISIMYRWDVVGKRAVFPSEVNTTSTSRFVSLARFNISLLVAGVLEVIP